MNNSLLIFASTIFFITQVSSASSIELAEKELANIKSKTINTNESSATVKVEPPAPLQNISDWNWQSALFIQSLTPTGRGSIQNDNFYNFENLGSTVFPSLEISVNYQPEDTQYKLSTHFKLGYAQQDIELETTRGFTYNDLKLNSTLTSVSWSALYTGFAKFNLGPMVEIGQLNYTQSSDSKLARFSENVAFIGYGVEGSYKMNPKLEALARLNQRNKVEKHFIAQSTSNKNIDIQNNNLELGVRYAW